MGEGTDPTVVVAVSGRVSVGKTTLARQIVDAVSGFHFSTRDRLIDAVRSSERASLQAAGADLDAHTCGAWVADGLFEALSRLAAQPTYVVVDSVRTREQIAVLEDRWSVFHIHLMAPPDVLAARHLRRARDESDLEMRSYDAVASDTTESRVDTLAILADVVVDTGESAPLDVFRAVVDALATSVDDSRHALAMELVETLDSS